MKSIVEKILKEAKQREELRATQLIEAVSAPVYTKSKDPIKETDKLRVYHGFNRKDDALAAVKYGLSGAGRAKRIYSYESVNNPNGLFVTIDFGVAKRFCHSGVILEFDTLVSNLDTPVWAGQDNYFVPGQMTGAFKNDEERTAEQLRKRKKYTEKDPEDYYKSDMGQRVSKSDRPELAYSLLGGGELQALFVGNLNPNNIKYVWFHHELYYNRRTVGDFVRMTRSEFLKMVKEDLEKNLSGKSYNNDNPVYNASEKFFKPDEDFTIEKLTTILSKKKYDVEAYLKHYGKDDYSLSRDFYPKQIKQLRKYLDDNKIEDLS